MEKLRDEVDDARVTLIHDSAEHLVEYLAKQNVVGVDYIVSGIPFVMLPDDLAEQVIGACHQVLRPGGQFMQFHYSPLLVQFYKRIFGNAEVDFVPLNIPPAFLITCSKTR